VATSDRISMARVLRRGRAAIVLALVVGCGPAQIGESREVFKAVDALYTAVSLREESALDRSAAILNDLRAAGKLPDSASAELVSITTEARAGRWEPARERLRDFMLGQHR
jgi:hypothetical protein